MKTVIFGIGHLKKLYWNDIDIVFFDEYGWWIKGENERELVDIYSFDLQLNGLSKKDTSGIVSELMEWMPIMSRWVGKGDQYELLIREAYFQVLYICEALKKLNIKNVIFQTAVSHHFPAVIFEKACEHSGIKPIFTYLEPLTERYILLQHINGVQNRKALNFNISDFQSDKLINEFIANKLKDNLPENHVSVKKRYSSFYYGIAYLIFRKNLSKIKQFIFKKTSKKNIRKIFFQVYLFQEYLQMLQQRKAIKFYKANVVDISLSSIKDVSKPKLLIAAHKQPEATSFPQGWSMSNHIDIVVELRRLGYQDEIVYKEHFTSFWYTMPILGITGVGMYRSVNYFEQLLKLGCKFIDTDYKLTLDSNKNNWYLPITITGTIAIERSLAGLHTIVMGYPWYKGLPGVIDINDISSLDSIREEWIKPDMEIAKSAKNFMNNLLTYNTLTSVTGIKNGNITKVTQNDLSSFKNEFDSLLLHLNLKK